MSVSILDDRASGDRVAVSLRSLIRSHEWAATPVGAASTWPQSLKTIIDVMLASKFPMCVGWGPDITLFYNDAYVPFLEDRHPAALGRPIAAVWADVWADIGPLIAQALAGESVAFDDMPLTMIRHGVPEPTWWTFSYSPVRDDDGRIAGFLNVSSETTAKQQALQQLQTLNATLEQRIDERSAALRLYENIVQSDVAPICAFDTDYRLIAFNRAHSDEFHRIYGYRVQIGDVFPDLFLPEQAAVVRALMTRALAGEVFSVTEEFGDPALIVPYWEVSFSPLRDETGRIIGAFHHAVDVSARLRAEAELGEAQDALRHAQKMEAIGQLTGGVAHDFNNLLTVIRGSVDLLRRDDVPAMKRQRYLDAIGETADRAAKLTGQLLAFARRQTLEPETFDVARQLDAVVEMLASVAGTSVQVRVETPGEPCCVRADISQFETALVNLAVNARDAMRGGGTIVIRLRDDARLPAIRGHGAIDGAFVAVSVSDTGAGIAGEHLQRIFEPFFTTKDIGRGTGLGLSQVIGFAKQSGGDVDVESVVGAGSTFTLYLPKVRSAVGAGGRAATPVETIKGAGQRVLLVEDNVSVGQFAAQVLEDLDYRTEWAMNAEEALERLGADGAGFDIVFSDVVMPGMGGIELVRRLAQTLPRLPVVLASGYSHILAQEGTDGIELLRKPYSAAQLSSILHRRLAGAAG